MLDDIWSFLKDDNNRTVLKWIAGLLGASGIGFVVKFALSRKGRIVTATHGSIAAGRDVRVDSGGRNKRRD